MSIKATNKFVDFVKRFGVYLCVGVVVLMVSLAFGITALLNGGKVLPTGTGQLKFSLPMENASIVKDFSSTELQENETLNQWEAHLSIDFSAENSNVFSVLDGKVTSVTYDDLEGSVITIEHSDGFVSKYASLAKDVVVKNGDKVKAGQKIGDASNTAGFEAGLGAHLHFTLTKDGTEVDPNNYLDLQNK